MPTLMEVSNYKSHLFLLGDPFSTLRSYLNWWQGLVIVDTTEILK